MKKYSITNDMEKTFKVANGRYQIPAKDFELFIENSSWSLGFHNEHNDGNINGSVEVNFGNSTIAYADVEMDQSGNLIISNLQTSSNYYFQKNISKKIAGFIKRACYDIAIINCTLSIAKAKKKNIKRKAALVTA